MAGNVWEWVNDWYSDNYYQQSPAQNPIGPALGTEHVLRGGSWNDSGRGIRSAYRRGGSLDDRDVDIGFRCAVSP